MVRYRAGQRGWLHQLAVDLVLKACSWWAAADTGKWTHFGWAYGLWSSRAPSRYLQAHSQQRGGWASWLLKSSGSVSFGPFLGSVLGSYSECPWQPGLSSLLVKPCCGLFVLRRARTAGRMSLHGGSSCCMGKWRREKSSGSSFCILLFCQVLKLFTILLHCP